MKRLIFSVVALLVATTSVMAQLNPMAPIEPDKDVRIGTLPSGLRYYIRHNEKPKGQADFYIRTDVGSIQEEDNQQGLAHFLEHMAFNGTKNLPGKTLIEYLEKIGVQFGSNLNANTSWDQTNYLIKDVPVAREGVIDTALLILHDWSSYITPQPAEIDNERGVIKEELRTRDNADWRSTLAMIGALGKDTRYAERNLIGYLDYLSSFEYSALTDFYESWYRPHNQAIVIVGDIDVDQVENKILTLMKDLPLKTENAPEKVVIKAIENKEPIISIYTDPEMNSSSLNLFIKHQAIPKEQNNLVISELLNIMKSYAGVMQNERFAEISMKPNAPFISAYLHIGSIGIMPTLESMMYGISTQEGKLQEGFEALYAEVEKTRRYGFTIGEFERAQANLLQAIEQQYNNRNDVSNGVYVERYLSNFSTNSPIPDAQSEYELDKMLIEALTVADINAFVQQLITAENQVITVNSPEKEGLVIPTESDFISAIAKVSAMELTPYEDNVVKVPLIDPAQKLKGSKVKKTKTNDEYALTEWTLKNGIQVIVRPSKLKADEVMLEAKAYGGLALLDDEDYHTGMFLADIASTSGVSTFSAIELQKQLSGKNASASIWANDYNNGMSASSSVKDVETMLQLVYLNFTAPRFNIDDFNTLKSQYYDYAKNARTSPDFLFSEFVSKSIYADNFRKQSLSTQMLDNINFKRLPAVFNTLYSNAESFRFVITGNVDLETLKPLVEKYVGSLPTEGKKIKFTDDNVRPIQGNVAKEFKTTMAQPKVSVLYYLNGKSEYTLKNEYTARFLSMALDNVYLKSVREEKGGTYGVHVNASISALPEESYAMQIIFDTNEKQADELCEIIEVELKKMAQEGPTEEQINKSRTYLLKEIENNKEQNSAWSSYIATLYTYGIDYAHDSKAVIESITAEDIKAMLQEMIDNDNMVKLMMRPE